MDMDVHGCGKETMTAREYLYNNLKSELQNYFGHSDEEYFSAVCDAWMSDESNSEHRFETMKAVIGDEKLRTLRILDMASVCGSFVFYGLLNGYDVYGVEPERWKHRFNFLKKDEKGYPESWMGRFCAGIGECLPIKDETFDVISTYQTLEHVESHNKCFIEFKRILKKNRKIFIQCPDYASFFEGHYQIPMLPLMNRYMFKMYLMMFGRPTKGLDTINYITKKKIVGFLDDDYRIYDIPLNHIKSRIFSKVKISSNRLASA
jgi:SAM-dependent methyltransferase